MSDLRLGQKGDYYCLKPLYTGIAIICRLIQHYKTGNTVLVSVSAKDKALMLKSGVPPAHFFPLDSYNYISYHKELTDVSELERLMILTKEYI